VETVAGTPFPTQLVPFEFPRNDLAGTTRDHRHDLAEFGVGVEGHHRISGIEPNGHDDPSVMR
jgi:hypothetical protein